MPIQGRFEANFAQFNVAVEQATVRLRGFEAGSAKVESSLSRMVDSFSGRKVISEATLMAEAIDRIGGPSRLTATELARVGTVAAEAAEKMRAWGQDVPEKISQLAEHAKATNMHFDTMKGLVKELALGFVAMFSVRTVANFVGDVIQSAGALKNLSAQTQIGVEDLQIMAGAMTASGVDAQELGRGVFTLSQRIAGGDDSVAGALHRMGLSLEDVRDLKGQELFLTIERGLGTLQGSLRDTTATDLFGSKLGMAMAGAAKDIDGAMESARRLTTVMGKDAVTALDTFDQTIARARRNLDGIAAQLIGPVAEGFNTLVDTATRGGSKWDIFVAVLQDFAASTMPGVTATSTNLAKVIDDLNQKIERQTAATREAAGAGRQHTEVLTAEQQAAAALAAIERDSAAALTPLQRQHLERLKELNALTKENAVAVGISAAQYAQYERDVRAAEKAERELDTMLMASLTTRTKALEEYTRAHLASYTFDAQLVQLHQLEAAERAVAKSVFDQIGSITERAKVIEATTMRHIEFMREEERIRLKQAAVTNGAVIAELEAQRELNAMWGTRAPSALETLNRKLEELHRNKIANIEQTNQESRLYREYTDVLYAEAIALETETTKQREAAEAKRDAAAASEQAKASVAAFTGTLVLGVRDIEEFNQKVNEMYDALARSQFGIPGSSVGAPGGRSVGGIGNIGYRPIVPRQAGGPVSAGGSYVVGERGPELFVPATSGAVMPSRWGGVSVQNTFHIVDNTENIARRVADEIMREILSGRRFAGA